MSTRPQTADGTENNAAPSYLSDTFVTDDGIEVPPPTRPMGPRRLSRYYVEAADYLRAIARGDHEPPPAPMFMGKVEGFDVKNDPGQALAGLSQMGNISTDEEELDFDFDENQVTVIEDPLGHIEQQILGEYDEVQPGTNQIDFASAPLELGGGDSDFISIEVVSDEEPEDAGRAVEAAPLPAEPPVATPFSAETFSVAPLPIEPFPTEAFSAVPLPTGGFSTETYSATPFSAETFSVAPLPIEPFPTEAFSAVPLSARNSGLQLPTPVRALDAQGLDLTELDEIAPLLRTQRPSANGTGSAVKFDSSGENNHVPRGYIIAESEEDVFVDESYEEDPRQKPGTSAPSRWEQATASTIRQPSSNTLSASKDVESAEAPQYTSLDEPRKSGAAVAVVGLLLLVAALVVVWVILYS